MVHFKYILTTLQPYTLTDLIFFLDFSSVRLISLTNCHNWKMLITKDMQSLNGIRRESTPEHEHEAATTTMTMGSASSISAAAAASAVQPEPASESATSATLASSSVTHTTTNCNNNDERFRINFWKLRAAWGLPSSSYESFHLELYLRVCKLDYLPTVASYPYSTSTGHFQPLPLVRIYNHAFASQAAFQYLAHHYCDLDENRSPSERSDIIAYSSYIRETLLGIVDYYLFNEIEYGCNSSLVQSEWATGVIPPVRFYLRWKRRRELQTNLQALSLLTDDKAAAKLRSLLAVLSDRLKASKCPYFYSSQPSSLDVTIASAIYYLYHLPLSAPAAESTDTSNIPDRFQNKQPLLTKPKKTFVNTSPVRAILADEYPNLLVHAYALVTHAFPEVRLYPEHQPLPDSLSTKVALFRNAKLSTAACEDAHEEHPATIRRPVLEELPLRKGDDWLPPDLLTEEEIRQQNASYKRLLLLGAIALVFVGFLSRSNK